MMFQIFLFQINAVLLNLPSIKESLKKISFHKNIKQLGISEGSCHSEDWSNDAENSALSQE